MNTQERTSEMRVARRNVWAAFLTLDDDIPDEHLDDEGLQDTLDNYRALICLAYGHWPTVDQCGLVEHDYCLVCGIRMPGQAEERAQ